MSSLIFYDFLKFIITYFLLFTSVKESGYNGRVFRIDERGSYEAANQQVKEVDSSPSDAVFVYRDRNRSG